MKINEEFYSYDKNNAQFEFIMDYDIPADKVIALFHFEKTNRYYETVCSVQGNLITIDFDTSLIVEDENVSGYLYFNKLEQSTDVYRFNFGVVVSEIDKTRYLPEEAITLRQLFLTEIATKKEVATLIEGLKNEMSKLTGGDISQLVTKEELENKHYLTNHQSLEEYAKKTELYNDEALRTKISAIEERFNNLSNIYLTSHQSLDHLATKQELNAVENRVQQLENKAPVDVSNLATKEELEQLRSNQPQVDHSNLVTKDELEGKHYLTEHQPLTDYAKRTELENLVTKQELTEKNYLTAHQSLTDYAKKSEIPNTSTFATVESVNNLLRTQGEQATKITALENKTGYEIHGTGMPNGRVSAPIGTTYVDTAVTNGALKWIKESGDGDRGWKVLIGDTGWRTLNIVSKLNTASLQIRRVNNAVTYNFGGLSWGWFGIVRRNGQGYVAQGTDFERNCFILTEHSVPVGFRTPNSLIGPIYNDRGVAYGTWYLGNPSDNNHLRFQFLNPIPTDSDIGDIRVSTISYYTDDEWPTTLP